MIHYGAVFNFFKRIFRKVRKNMEDQDKKEVFIDAEYNWLKTILDPKIKLREFLDYQVEKYKSSINKEKISRYLKNLNSPLLDPEKSGPFLNFYMEARDLYREGFFHSCIAMCRITAEKMCETLVDVADITADDKTRLLNLRFYDLVWVMLKLNIIHPDIFTELNDIRKIGNNYVHPKESINPSIDSENVINSLGKLINRTSDILNQYDIIQGKLIPRVKNKK